MSAPAYRLRYYVSLQSRPPGTTAGGERLDWVEYKKAWADIRAAGGLETIKANAVASTSRVSVRFRNRSDLNSGMRIVHGGTIYEILSVPPFIAGERFIDLVCEVNT